MNQSNFGAINKLLRNWGHVLTPFFDTCQGKRWSGEGLPIWKEPACMMWESANFVATDGLRRYSNLEGIGVNGMEICR